LRLHFSWFLFGVLMAWAGPAHGTILTFQFTDAAQWMPIAASYGDHVDALTRGSFSYEMGNGLTPQVGIAYRSLDPTTGTMTTPYLSFWDTRYGNLTNVAYPTNPSDMGEISLIPEKGWKVRLNSFDLAGWPNTDYAGQPVRILDGDRGVLANYTPLMIPGNGHITIAPNLEQAGPIRIQFGSNWDIGIKNVNFDQIPAAPEPSSLVLLVLGTAGLLAYTWRRKAAT
jgi:hypothetical protein